MSKIELEKRPLSHSAPSEVTGGASLTLPPDLVENAGRRLGIAALVYAAAYTLAYGAGRFSGGWIEQWGSMSFPQMPDLIAGSFIGASVALFFFARSGAVTGQRLLDHGLLYEVLAAAGIDIQLVFGNWPAGFHMSGISWVCVWIVFFPLIVPSTPKKTAVAALAAASTTPLLYAIGIARGGPLLDAGATTQVILANYICAGIAIVGSRVIYRMGTDISRARRMGSYQLVEKLGEGGMGEVWKAEHRMLARPAAIKLVRGGVGTGPGRSGGTEHHRFEREVQATAQLRSPHTVEVYDYGLTEDRTFYYVMELLDGLSLEELVKRYGPVPPERVAHILRQACHSLGEAHARGIVHRDVKPANLFLCRYGQDVDFVKVLDFGLVKRAGTPSRQDVKLTDVGTFAGTPAYGSPEGAAGEGDEVDPRSDLYSLGCVGYWLLTGRTVFQASSPMLMLVQHIHQPPEPPSKHTELPIPAELDAVILDCLRKDKAERPHSAEMLASRLAAVPFASEWSPERSRLWWDTHRPERATQPVPDRDTGGAASTPQVVKL